MGRAFGDFQQPCLTDTEVVIGELDSQLLQHSLDRSQLGDADLRLLRDLDDELVTPSIEASELVQRIEIIRPGQLRRVEIDEESKPRGQHGPDLQRLGPEQAAQVAFHLTLLGELKELGGALMQAGDELPRPRASKPTIELVRRSTMGWKWMADQLLRNQLAKRRDEPDQAHLLTHVGFLSHRRRVVGARPTAGPEQKQNSQ